MTVVTRDPQATLPITGKWWLSQNAYTSNNAYAFCSLPAIQQYHDYDFDSVLPPALNITKVEVGLEFYCLLSESLQVRISTDGGLTWSLWSIQVTLTGENLIWLDATSYHATWLRDYLLDANWKVQVRFYTSGGGACPEKVMWTAYLDWIPTRVTYDVALAKLRRLLLKQGL